MSNRLSITQRNKLLTELYSENTDQSRKREIITMLEKDEEQALQDDLRAEIEGDQDFWSPNILTYI